MPLTIAVEVEQLHKNRPVATLQYRSDESHAAAFSKTYTLKLAAYGNPCTGDRTRTILPRISPVMGTGFEPPISLGVVRPRSTSGAVMPAGPVLPELG